MAAPAAAQAGQPTGIDVSNHQGYIDWAQVAKSGEQFAIAKATEGVTFEDSWYEANRSGAEGNGLEFGAYHYARPEGSTRTKRKADAKAEAKHFTAVAGLRTGNLLPVLDLETTGGLSARQLKKWVRTWLREVRDRVGSKGMIYTYPSFWRTAMDDTKWFARNGYKSLWIAHYTSFGPDVPAEDWDGTGWAFWQYTDCGEVPGVSGCVDRNRYEGGGFDDVRIR